MFWDFADCLDGFEQLCLGQLQSWMSFAAGSSLFHPSRKAAALQTALSVIGAALHKALKSQTPEGIKPSG